MVRGAIFTAAMVLTAAMAFAKAEAKPTDGTAPRVVIELFQVALIDDARLSYLRREAVLGRRGPEAVLGSLLGGDRDVPALLSGRPLMVHSTSWR